MDGVISNIGDNAFSGCNLSSLDATVGGDIGAYAFSDNTGLWYISPIRGSVGNYAFKGTNMDGKDVFIVSGHSGTLGAGEITAGVLFPSILYTGTEAEFTARYTNNTGKSNTDKNGIIKFYRRMGGNVQWKLDDDGVLYISGSGSTIDLLDYTEQPWLNIPGRTLDENREQITKVLVSQRVQLGAHMLDYLEDKVEIEHFPLGNLDWTLFNGTLTVSGTGAIPNLYQKDDKAWMPFRNDIRQIVIEEGVTGVGFGSFMQCPNLTSVSFPESVTGIAGGAFYQCPKLDNVSLPGKLKTLGSNAFTDCAGLKTVYIPGSVTSIGSQAFDHTGLTDIYYGGTTADWAALGKGEVTGATVRIDGVSGVRFHASAYGLPPMVGEEHSHIAACTAPTVCLECGETVEDAVIVHDYRLQSDADGCYYQCADCGDILVRLRHYTECLDPDAEACAFCGFPLKDATEYEKGLHVGAYDQVYEENGKLYHECVCMECGETVLEKHEVEPVAKDEGEADFHSLVCAADGFVVDLEEHNWIASEDGRAVCAVCGAAEEAFPVTFDANAHGRPSQVVAVPAGQPVERPADPTVAGYVFGGWYLEPDCLTPYDFSAPVTAELVLYAKWTAQPSRSSGGGGGGSVTYGITVDKTENGGVTASPAYAAQGRTVTLTVKPDEGYQLDKLTVTDKNGQEVAVTSKEDGSRTFTMPGSAVTVAASFAAETPAPEPEPEPEPGGEGCPKDETCPVSAFTDASPDAWYHDGVHWALENGVMNGTGETTFDPNGSTTRAMVVTMLWRLEGKPAPDAPAPFTDVEPGAWYADAVAWAAESGVVNGISETSFAPDASVTREQLAAILYRCAQAKGQGFTGMWYFPLDFTDASEVSEYADEAMHWMVMKGIIKGRTETTLNPKNQSSRAEIATILMRYFTAMGAE